MPQLNKDELRSELAVLRRICESPAFFLSNYFNYMRNQVDQAIFLAQLDRSDEENNEKLNLIWKKMISKIDLFEQTCSDFKLDTKLALERLNSIESILLNDKRKGNLEVVLDFLLFYLETIQSEETHILKQLFQNKTIAFVHVPNLDRQLMRHSFEWKLIVINDEFINLNAFHRRYFSFRYFPLFHYKLLTYLVS